MIRYAFFTISTEFEHHDCVITVWYIIRFPSKFCSDNVFSPRKKTTSEIVFFFFFTTQYDRYLYIHITIIVVAAYIVNTSKRYEIRLKSWPTGGRMWAQGRREIGIFFFSLHRSGILCTWTLIVLDLIHRILAYKYELLFFFLLTNRLRNDFIQFSCQFQLGCWYYNNNNTYMYLLR